MSHAINATVKTVTDNIIQRSADSRARYLAKVQASKNEGVSRQRLSCGNLAHGVAACAPEQKELIAKSGAVNLGIVTAYNDMLSAHQPYEHYPQKIRDAARKVGASVQVAGGVPAMCDGVTQGREGMELSLLSREVIAMSTAVALSHDMFDGALLMGVCDKIVPGLLIGALSFGHYPMAFVPAGPMASGIANHKKAKARQLYAQDKLSREEMFEVESASYHSAGTCTFYGTANSNQMLMEIMGLQLAGSSFVAPDDPLRPYLTEATTEFVVTTARENGLCLAEIVSEKTIVNGLIGLLATGGSTNLLIHVVAIAAAAGVKVTWKDVSELSSVVPLLCRVYPNGESDINHFHRAGGMPLLVRELLKGGLLHEDVKTVMGSGLQQYASEPKLEGEKLVWKPIEGASLAPEVLTTIDNPFQSTGGLQRMKGNLGEGVIKLSAVAKERHIIEAPAIVFSSQNELQDAFKRGELNRDFVAVVKGQGPQANGMPELHQLLTPLGVLQDEGFKVALVTDGRLSGASGKVPSVIHVTPEAVAGGAIAGIKNGDVVRVDATQGEFDVLLDADVLAQRCIDNPMAIKPVQGMGRELFSQMRALMNGASDGATMFRW